MDTSWMLLILMAYSLGVRHGFDLDHLATIDAITRTVRENKQLSSIVGCLFSLGHGIVVTLLSIIIGSGMVNAHIPEGLDKFGAWISISFLFLFGIANLINIVQNPSKPRVPLSIKSYLSRKLTSKKATPLFILMVGALFAFSFDTFSQVALFVLSASVTVGWIFSGVLGLSFTLGMMTSDGLNGLIVSRWIQRADKTSVIISRATGFAIASFSLIVGIIGLLHA